MPQVYCYCPFATLRLNGQAIGFCLRFESVAIAGRYFGGRHRTAAVVPESLTSSNGCGVKYGIGSVALPIPAKTSIVAIWSG